MNAALLLDHYERIAEAPDAIARLRRFVLDLAVRGKLVEQDPTEKPASEKLGEAGINEFAIVPEQPGWASAKVGRLLAFQYGKGLPASDRLDNGPIPVFGSNGVVASTHSALTTRPAIIVGRKGSAGALNLCDGPSWTTDVAYFVEAPSFFLIRYLMLALSALGLDQLGKGVKPGLSRSDAYALNLFVPPLAEQGRILAKVDQLMSLCDQLETAQADRERQRDKLTVSTLAQLNEPDHETFTADARFALEHLEPLTKRTDQIKQLRQTILNLAVRGKLVAQDPNNEPASELLKRIKDDVAAICTGLGLKRSTILTAVDAKDAPFELPNGWAWARFPEAGAFGRGRSKHRPRNDPALYADGTHLMIQTGDVARSRGEIQTFTAKYNDVGLAQSRLWPKGTLCITIAANIADSGILGFDACFPDSVVGFVPASCFENARHFEYFMRTAKADLLAFAPATAQKNINLDILMQVLIPLPPLPEQNRIVAKVDALMALCDQLEASLTEGEQTRSKLLEAVLHETLEPA